MPLYAYAVILGGTGLWFTPFLITRFNFKAPQTVDRRARWGIFLEFVAFTLLWQGPFWARAPQPWQVAISGVFMVLANLLSWSGARALGKQLRVDAAVGADHELIRSGPYRIVRHPIYTSMLCLLFGIGVITVPLWLMMLALVLFLGGTEIRVRVEDGLLAARFGEDFRKYQSTTPRYIPFVW
jgi:protein-S-isoprenylcysteine O-methyltransferase Ste14